MKLWSAGLEGTRLALNVTPFASSLDGPSPEPLGVKLARWAFAVGSFAFLSIGLSAYLERPEQPLVKTLALSVLAAAFVLVTWLTYLRFPWDGAHWPSERDSRLGPYFGRVLMARVVVTAGLILLEPSFVSLTTWILGQAVATWRSLHAPWLYALLALALLAYGGGYLQRPPSALGLLGFFTVYGMWIVVTALLFAVAAEVRTRERLVRELRRANAALETARLAEAEVATLRERGRLARDLHDLMGRSLVLASVQLETALKLAERDPIRVAPNLEVALEVLRDSTRELRRSLAGLRDGTLDGRSLAAAIPDRLRAEADLGGWTTQWQVSDDALSLPPVIEDAFWRVLQESLNNARQHARASQVSVRLERIGGHARLEVSDDGVGCNGFVEGRYGLRGMRERCSALGGRLEIVTNAPGGTTIRAEIPIASPGSEL